MTSNLNSNSPESTFGIGERIGSVLKGNEIILLSGELGAGKTLLTKGIASSLFIDPNDVVSPSFTLINHFKGKYRFFHVDLYRLGDKTIQSLPEIDEYIDEGVIVIEWAQFLENSYFNLKNSIDIKIQITEENNRVLKIKTSLDHFSIEK